MIGAVVQLLAMVNRTTKRVFVDLGIWSSYVAFNVTIACGTHFSQVNWCMQFGKCHERHLIHAIS